MTNSILRNTMLAGLGIYALTKEKAQRLSADLVKRGELSKEDGAQFIKDIMEKADEEVDHLKELIDKQLKQAVSKLQLPYQHQLDALNKKIDKLTKEVEKLRR